MTMAKPAKPRTSDSGRGIGSFGARYREYQRGAAAPASRRLSAGVTGAAVPSGLLERLDEGGVNGVLRARNGLDLPDPLPELRGLREDLVDRSRPLLRPVVLLAL